MFLRQILHDDLGCASYLIASDGEAAVVDPKWEIGAYLQAAAEVDAEIRHVLETHFHADHVSGRRRLVGATGAVPHVPADPQRRRAGGLRDGDTVSVGAVTLMVLATPGHRPEHLAYLATEPDRPGARAALLSGDSLLIGELARPDLAVEAEDGARALWATVRRLTALDDSVEVWPGHVGGSLCGSGALCERTSSTIGEERSTNPWLSVRDVDAFVQELTRGVPARPPRVERVVALNLRGAGAVGPVRELDPNGFATFVAAGACVLDVRSPDVFDLGHVAGAVNLPAGGQGLGTRAGWALAPGESAVIVSQTLEDGRDTVSLLYAAGVDSVGVSVADPDGWAVGGLPVERAHAFAPRELVPLLEADDVQLVDVRDRVEWKQGHVAGSLHLPLHELRDRSAVVLSDRRPLAIACAGGRRAALAASVLRRRGRRDVSRVTGGVADLADRGVALVAGE